MSVADRFDFSDEDPTIPSFSSPHAQPLADIPVRSFGRSIYCAVNPARAALQDSWLEQQFGPARGGK